MPIHHAGWRGRLPAESRAAYRAFDLHFRDLRREFASRPLESKADLHDVSELLGHANVSQTSMDLKSRPTRLKNAIDQMEQATSSAHHSHTETKDALTEPSEEDS